MLEDTVNDVVTLLTQTCDRVLVSEHVQDHVMQIWGSQEGCSITFDIDGFFLWTGNEMERDMSTKGWLLGKARLIDIFIGRNLEQGKSLSPTSF